MEAHVKLHKIGKEIVFFFLLYFNIEVNTCLQPETLSQDKKADTNTLAVFIFL